MSDQDTGHRNSAPKEYPQLHTGMCGALQPYAHLMSASRQTGIITENPEATAHALLLAHSWHMLLKGAHKTGELRSTHMHGQRQLQRGACEEHGHKIGVHVACRPPVLIPAREDLDVRRAPAAKCGTAKAVHFLILHLPVGAGTAAVEDIALPSPGGTWRASGAWHYRLPGLSPQQQAQQQTSYH